MNGLYIAASGAATELEALNITAQNLANANTPGFRKLMLSMGAENAGPSPFEFATEVGGPRVDLSQGPIRSTGNPLDIALVGPGFIRVQTQDGEAYTRDGQLQVSPDGLLMAAGQPIIKIGGGTLTIPAGPVTIGTDGTVNVNGNPQGQISIGKPGDQNMVGLGSGLYRSENGVNLADAGASTQVKQGFIEESGGNPIMGMNEMLSALREYEAAMRAVQSIDETQDKTIQAFTIEA